MSTKVIRRPARTRPVSGGRCIHDKRCHLWPGKLRASRWTVTSKGRRRAVAGNDVKGSGTPQDPWILKTPPGTSEFEAYRDPDAAPPALVVQVGTTELRYHLRCIEDLHAMLAEARRLDAARQRRRAEAGEAETPSRRGAGPPTTPLAAGTASRRAYAVGSATTCRRCSRHSAWPRSSTTHATTGCERGDGQALPPGRSRTRPTWKVERSLTCPHRRCTQYTSSRRQSAYFLVERVGWAVCS